MPTDAAYIPSHNNPAIASAFIKWSVTHDAGVSRVAAIAPSKPALASKLLIPVLVVLPFVVLISWKWTTLDASQRAMAMSIGSLALLAGLSAMAGAILHAFFRQCSEATGLPLLVVDRTREVISIPRKPLEIPIAEVPRLHRVSWWKGRTASTYCCHVVLEWSAPEGTRWIPLLRQVPPVIFSSVDRMLARTLAVPLVTAHYDPRTDWPDT